MDLPFFFLLLEVYNLALIQICGQLYSTTTEDSAITREDETTQIFKWKPKLGENHESLQTPKRITI